MAESLPVIEDAQIPDEIPPGNKVQAEVTIRQTGPDPWFSDGDCQPSFTTLTGWKTPIKAYVDGNQVHEQEACIPNNNSKTVQVPFQVPQGSHDVKIEVYSIGGNAYLPGVSKSVNDDVTRTVVGNRESSDPSGTSSPSDILDDLASSLGTSVSTVAIGGALAAALLMVVVL